MKRFAIHLGLAAFIFGALYIGTKQTWAQAQPSKHIAVNSHRAAHDAHDAGADDDAGIASEPPSTDLVDALERARQNRCLFAVCWGPHERYALEFVIDMPISIVFAVGRSSLTSYINAYPLNVEFNAGLRLWIANDLVSFMVYFAKPVARSGDSIRLLGSPFEFPASAIHRPYPSIGIGIFGDLIQIGFAYDMLVNGDRGTGDPRLAPNDIVSRSLTITIGISSVQGIRTMAASMYKPPPTPAAKK